jgi:hypothetical protein
VADKIQTLERRSDVTAILDGMARHASDLGVQVSAAPSSCCCDVGFVRSRRGGNVVCAGGGR